MSLASRPIQHGYAILRLTVDDQRGDTLPVGVAAWDSVRGWFGTRVLDGDESLPGVAKWNRKFLDIATGQLKRWAAESRVPYEPDPARPFTAQFWQAASEVLSTAVRVDPPRAMDPMEEPDQELEALYEAVVQPRQPELRRQERIDGALSRALGDLADEIPTKAEVQAFGRARETVRRGAVTREGVLLVDGVNLAASTARADADALVSRFMRIRRAYEERPVHVIVGYTTSPGGLNGETHMRDWIRLQLTHEVLDLSSESQEFRNATRNAWNRLTMEDQASFF